MSSPLYFPVTPASLLCICLIPDFAFLHWTHGLQVTLEHTHQSPPWLIFSKSQWLQWLQPKHLGVTDSESHWSLKYYALSFKVLYLEKKTRDFNKVKWEEKGRQSSLSLWHQTALLIVVYEVGDEFSEINQIQHLIFSVHGSFLVLVHFSWISIMWSSNIRKSSIALVFFLIINNFICI